MRSPRRAVPAKSKPDVAYDAITEKAWQAEIVEALGYLGWRHYATWTSLHSVPGFPDIIALHPRARDVLVAELKTERGKATPQQLEWLAWFERVGIDAYLWRPSDIDEVLERLRHPRALIPTDGDDAS